MASIVFGVISAGFTYVSFAMFMFMMAAGWVVFKKAGWPGWAMLVPIYNLYVWVTIAGKPWWWLLLTFIPIAGIVVSIILCISMAESFGRGVGFGIGLVLLGPIFLPILAFEDIDYVGTGRGPQAAGA